MSSHGYAGRVLRVDLSEKTISVEQLSDDLIKDFIGGRGIAVKMLYDEVDAKTKPLDPQNRLIISAGPLSGTFAPSAGRCHCTTKSATTGILGDTNVGGHFGAELKFAGYDHIVISGKSDRPVYLWICDEKVEIRDATHLWGLDTWETTSIIRNELGDSDIQVLAIGQAGEQLVKYAAIICNLTRAAGRGGTGAVFGSKQLKAIAVRGTKGVNVANGNEFLASVEELFKRIYNDPSPRQRSVEGTPSLVLVSNMGGWLSYRNMQSSKNDDIADKLSAQSFLKYSVKSKGCFNCPVHCSHYYVVKEGPFEGLQGEGLEFASIQALGIMTGVDYFPAVIKANELANRYGFDTVSLGDMIAWAMECFEKGLITERDTDGLRLEFGNYESMLALIEKIVKREGIGDILADNVVDAANRIGNNSIEFAHQIKGLTIEGDLRGKCGMSLGYAVSNIGAHHVRGAVLGESGWLARAIPDQVAIERFGSKEAKNPYSYEGKERIVQWYEQITIAADSLGICKFVTTPYSGQKLITLEDLAILLSQATGMAFTKEDFEMAAERVLAVERAFNARQGMSRKDDTMPPRMWEPVKEGPHKGFAFDREGFRKALDSYYSLHGWTENGIPSKKTLEKLNLRHVGEELEALGVYGSNCQ